MQEQRYAESHECFKIAVVTIFTFSLQVHEFIGELSEFKNLERLINETVKKFGGIDILINNAGFGDAKSIAEVESPY